MRTGSRYQALALGALVLLCFTAYPARAVDTCANSRIPTLGNDTNPGYVPAGPALISPGGTGYVYAINSTDYLQLYVQTAPGVGTTSSFTRKLWIALSGTDNDTYPAANELVNSGCQMSWNYFADISTPPAGISITQSASLTDMTDAANEPTCYFNHLYAINWETFRSTLDNCGFTISTNNSSPTNGTYKKYQGRVHVKWADYNDTTDSGLVRPAATTWYDVQIQVQDTANATSSAVNSTEVPYNADFQVSSVTYSKASSGAVTAFIAFSLTTAYPYYAAVNGSTASDFLIHSGTTYAGLTLAGQWSYQAVRDGTVKSDGNPCSTPGDVCQLSGTLKYTWTPATGSCSLSSTQFYQFDFVLACNSTGVSNSCGAPMRSALALPSFGSFELAGNIDFCKAASTDFPISWPAPFNVQGGTSRTIGSKIVTEGTLSANKKIYGIALKNYRVVRSGLSGEWSLWNAGDTDVPFGGSGYAGSLTTIGTNTGFVFAQPVSSNNGFEWALSASFTPNIKLYSTSKVIESTTDSGNFMVSLPNDKGDTISFVMSIDLRLYTDSVSPFARKRRLRWRDARVQSGEPAAIRDASASTDPVGIAVPVNMQVSTDGTVTVVKTSTAGLSTGAVAGIAAMGAIVGIIGAGLAVFAVRRHQKKAHEGDTEAADKAVAHMLEGELSEEDKKRMSMLLISATAYSKRSHVIVA